MRAFIKNNMTVIIFTSVLAGSLFILSRLLYDSYQNYTDTVVTQEQQHLLAISSSVANNLSLYMSGELDKLEMLTESQGFQSELQEYYENRQPEDLRRYVLGYMYKQGLSRIYVLDENKNIIIRYDPKPLSERFENDFLAIEPLVTDGGSGVGGVFNISPHHVAIPIVDSIYSEGRYIGAAVCVMDLQNLYNEAVAPVAVGKAGFLTVADHNGTVIMHPAEARVGTNYFANPFLKQGYFIEQQAMRREQYSQVSGTGKFRTVWWLSPYASKVEVIIGYARAQAGENFWVVSAIMDYKEAMEISNANVPKMAYLVIALLVLSMVGFAAFWHMHRNRQELLAETRSLKVLNSALEDLNNSREELMHYQKLQTIGNFANGIAHEFNNLLTPILGLSDILRDDLKDMPQAKEDVETIRQSGLKARELISQILTFGRRGLDKESFSVLPVNTLIEDLLRIVKTILPPSIKLVTDFEHGDACCMGNKTQLHQVALNLCSNAYHAMEDCGGTLLLKTRLVAAAETPAALEARNAEHFIEFSIKDTGCGIEPAVLEHIFDPYFTTKESGKGTGLGLAMVQGIVKGHDGYIEVQSTLGEGSVFRVYLPEAPSAFTPSENTAATPTAPEKQGKPVSVMLIDDVEDVAKTLARMLEKVGYRVRAYTNPLEAVDNFERAYRSYDIIITDYAMPGMNGIALANRIKALRRDIPIILVTSHKEAELGETGQLFARVMHKPLDFGMLCDYTEAALREPKKRKSGN